MPPYRSRYDVEHEHTTRLSSGGPYELSSAPHSRYTRRKGGGFYCQTCGKTLWDTDDVAAHKKQARSYY